MSVCVAATPESVKKLIGVRGFVVRVQRGAGALAGIADEAYGGAGAELVDDPWLGADVLRLGRLPTLDGAARLKEGAVLVALLQPERNPGPHRCPQGPAGHGPRAGAGAAHHPRAEDGRALLDGQPRGLPRRAFEAAHHFQGPFSLQVTAAGTTLPARVLVIGAGVAGLADDQHPRGRSGPGGGDLRAEGPLEVVRGLGRGGERPSSARG